MADEKRDKKGQGVMASVKFKEGVRAAGWSDLLDRADVLILDTETTGFGDKAEVLEVAILDTTGAVRFESLSMPEGEIPSAASHIHGLTKEELEREKAPAWPDIHGEVSRLLANASVVLAWNASYDRRMLNRTAERHRLTWPDITWRDLLGEYKNLRPGEDKNSLSAVAKRLGVKSGTAHRAKGDCQIRYCAQSKRRLSNGAGSHAGGDRRRF
jgi:DNA polymerase-3 subunit epsilon